MHSTVGTLNIDLNKVIEVKYEHMQHTTLKVMQHIYNIKSHATYNIRNVRKLATCNMKKRLVTIPIRQKI